MHNACSSCRTLSIYIISKSDTMAPLITIISSPLIIPIVTREKATKKFFFCILKKKSFIRIFHLLTHHSVKRHSYPQHDWHSSTIHLDGQHSQWAPPRQKSPTSARVWLVAVRLDRESSRKLQRLRVCATIYDDEGRRGEEKCQEISIAQVKAQQHKKSLRKSQWDHSGVEQSSYDLPCRDASSLWRNAPSDSDLCGCMRSRGTLQLSSSHVWRRWHSCCRAMAHCNSFHFRRVSPFAVLKKEYVTFLLIALQSSKSIKMHEISNKPASTDDSIHYSISTAKVDDALSLHGQRASCSTATANVHR